MTKHALTGTVAAAIIAVIGTAAFASSSGASQNIWFQVDKGALFSDWRAQVQQMVGKAGGSAVNHVCVVGWQRRSDLATQQAYLIWPEQHRLITWIPSDDPDSLAHQTRVLDLKRDVVANDRAVNGSTYLVTRAWVANVERHCHRFGTTLTLQPSGTR